MDQEEKERTKAADSAVISEDVPSGRETENTSGTPEKAEEQSKTTDNVPSSAAKIMEQPTSDKPDNQPTSAETQNEGSSAESSGDIHSTENPSPEQHSAVNATEKMEELKPDNQTATASPNTDDDKPGKDLDPIENEKQTEIEPEPIARGAKEMKPSEKPEEPFSSDQTSDQQSDTTDYESDKNLQTVEGKNYIKQPEEDPRPTTQEAEEQTPNDEPTKDLQPTQDEVEPEHSTKWTEEQNPLDGKSEEAQHSVSEQNANINIEMSSSETETADELKSGVQDVPATGGPSTTRAGDQDTAVDTSTNLNDATEVQSPTVNESAETKLKDTGDSEPQTEVIRQQTEVSQDTNQRTIIDDTTTAIQQTLADEQPSVAESIPNKNKDDSVNVKKDELSNQAKDAVQEERPSESKTETEGISQKPHKDVSAQPEKQDSGKESLNAPVEEVTKASVEEVGSTDKVETEGPRHRIGKTTGEEKTPEDEIKAEGDAGVKGDSNNVQNQGRQFTDELIDTLGQLQESLDSPIVCALVVFAMVAFVVLLRCMFSLNAICYTLLYYSVLIIFGYPLTLCMARNNLDRSVIRLVVGIFCVLFSVLFYKCRPTITWMTEISEYL